MTVLLKNSSVSFAYYENGFNYENKLFVAKTYGSALFYLSSIDPVINTSAYSSSGKIIVETNLTTVGDREILSYGTMVGRISNPNNLPSWAMHLLINGTSGGNLPWYAVENKGKNGGVCLRSGAITHSQTSSLSIVITGPTVARFDAKGSGETNYDKLGVYLDNVQQGSFMSGENTPYVHFDVTIPAGTHTLRFTFQKDSALSKYEDCGYVDNFVIDGVNFSGYEYDQKHEVSYSGSFLQSTYDTGVLMETTYYCKSFVKTFAKTFYSQEVPVITTGVSEWAGIINGMPNSQIAGIAIGNNVIPKANVQKVVVGNVVI